MVEYFSKISLEKSFNLKIKNYNKQGPTKELSVNQNKEIEGYFSNLGFLKINKDWHKFYTSKNFNFQKEYIPENIYYSQIEPSLNRVSMYPAYFDKNLLSKLFDFIQQPKTIIKRVNNFYFSNQDKLIEIDEVISICTKYPKYVIKPSLNTGGGKNVQLIKSDLINHNENVVQIKQLIKSYSNDFIIQEALSQNNKMKALNESSVNTIRIMSYLKGVDVHILSSVVRIGRIGQFTDNSATGGISCGISSNGKLKKVAYDTFGTQYFNTDNGCKLESFKIPKYNEVISVVEKMHKLMPNFKIISWDIAIDKKDRVTLIEMNLQYQEINFHQLNNGPLFNNLTDEILNGIRIS